MNAHPASFHLLDALWSSSRLNTATGQQRAGDDQPSRPAKYPLQAGKPHPLGQVSPGARTSEKIRRPASRPRGSRFFPFGPVVRGLSCIKRPLGQPIRMWGLQRRCGQKAQEVREFAV